MAVHGVELLALSVKFLTIYDVLHLTGRVQDFLTTVHQHGVTFVSKLSFHLHVQFNHTYSNRC